MKNFLKRTSDPGLGWLIAWGLIYVGFLSLGIAEGAGVPATALKYGGLVLCFVYVLLHSKTDVFLVLALGLTLVADGVLIHNNVSEVGVGVFILVQVVYFIRFSQIRAVSPLVPLLVAALVIVVGLLQNEIPRMFVLASAYAILIFSNIYAAIRWYKDDHSRASRCAVVGFILFLLCDCCVGVSFLTTTSTLPHMITLLANYLAWAFYLPSQIGLALSGGRAEFRNTAAELPEIKVA